MRFNPIPFKSHSEKKKVKKKDLLSVESYWEGNLIYDNNTVILDCRLIKSFEYKKERENDFLGFMKWSLSWVIPYSSFVYGVIFGDEKTEHEVEELDRKTLKFAKELIEDVKLKRYYTTYEIGIKFKGIDTPPKSMLWFDDRINFLVERKHKPEIDDFLVALHKNESAYS